MEKTYWNHAGKYQATILKLQALIPSEGSVASPAKNKALEKFRKAQNCYYDLYNNGLCNRAASFSKIFGIAAGNYKQPWRGYGSYSPMLYERTEEAINSIIEAAAAEQGIELSTQLEMFA